MEPLHRPVVIVAERLVDFETGSSAHPPSEAIISPIARLLADAFISGYRIVVPRTCVTAFTPDDNAAGLASMERMYGATTVSVDDILRTTA